MCMYALEESSTLLVDVDDDDDDALKLNDASGQSVICV